MRTGSGNRNPIPEAIDHSPADTWEELAGKELKRLSSLRMQMLDIHVFWGAMLLPMKLIPKRMGVPMATDCVDRIWFDPELTRFLPLRQLGYVLLHEVFHVAFESQHRRGARRAHLWNVATDLAINRNIERLCGEIRGTDFRIYETPGVLLDGEVHFRPLLDPRYDGLPAELIYEELRKSGEYEKESGIALDLQLPLDSDAVSGAAAAKAEAEPEWGPERGPDSDSGVEPGRETESQSGSDPGQDPDAGSMAGPGTQAQPELGAESVRNNNSRSINSNNIAGDGKTPGNPDEIWDSGGLGDDAGEGVSSGKMESESKGTSIKRNARTWNLHVVTHGSGIDVHLPIPSPDPRAHERVLERMIDCYQQWKATDSRGEIPAEIARVVREASGLAVDWRRLFHQLADPFIGREEFSLSHPNRRHLEADFIVPGLTDEKLSMLVVSVDTSGSMDSRFLDAVAAEIRSLADKAEECLVITCDARVHDVIRTEGIRDFLGKKRWRGGGGTSHLPVFDYIRRNHVLPSLFIGITDLLSEFPKRPPPYPILWVVPRTWNRLLRGEETSVRKLVNFGSILEVPWTFLDDGI